MYIDILFFFNNDLHPYFFNRESTDTVIRPKQFIKHEKRMKKKNMQKEVNELQSSSQVIDVYAILGNYSQTSEIFNGRGRGLQCVANCIISILYTYHKHCNIWDRNDLTNILKSGNELYNFIGKFTLLMVKDIPTQIELYNKCFTVSEGASIIGSTESASEEFMLQKFSTLHHLFTRDRHYVLVLGIYAMAVVVHHGNIYVFDPHNRDKYGMPHPDGKCVLLAFDAFHKFNYFVSKLSLMLGEHMYELVPVNVQIICGSISNVPLPHISGHSQLGTHTNIEKQNTSNAHNYKGKDNLSKSSIKRKKPHSFSPTCPSKKRKVHTNVNNIGIQDNAAELSGTLDKNVLSSNSAKSCPKNLCFKVLKTSDPMKIIIVNKMRDESDLMDGINKFNSATSEGPIYVCSICHQTNFKSNVTKLNTTQNRHNSNLLTECNTHYTSLDGLEYVCTSCRYYLNKGKVPKLSIRNGCGFNIKPEELYLYPLEERYISPVMAFMLIHQLASGGQYSIKGSICHVPIEVNQVVNTLPRNFANNETIAVKLKRRLCYNNSVFHENVRPYYIVQALKYLMDHSTLYKEHNIIIDNNWVNQFQDNTDDNAQSVTCDEDDDATDDTQNEQVNAPSVNTMLTNRNIDANASVLCIAPGEGQTPIFTDSDTEYLCFPSIFCGERRSENNYHKLKKTEIFKYELRSIDPRVSTNIPNIFWKTKWKQVNQISQKVNFCLRRRQTKGKKYKCQHATSQ